MTDYKPGQICKATVRGVPDVTVMRMDSDEWAWRSAVAFHGTRLHNECDLTDVRPLVVLDPSAWHPEFVAYIPQWLRTNAGNAPSESFVRYIADQIEAQTRPAIEEPKGLGAVVEDDKGVRYVRGHESSNQWEGPDEFHNWAEITPVRVLSEGVES